MLKQGAENRPDIQQTQPSAAWHKRLFRVALIQLLTALMVSFFSLFWHGVVVAVSLMSGGILVGVNSVLLARSVVSSSQVEGADSRGVLYRSAIVRFLLLIVALIGAYLSGLVLPAVAAGMFAAYVGGYIYIVKSASRPAG